MRRRRPFNPYHNQRLSDLGDLIEALYALIEDGILWLWRRIRRR